MKLIDYSFEDQDYFTETFLNRCHRLKSRVDSSDNTKAPSLDSFLLSQIQINH